MRILRALIAIVTLASLATFSADAAEQPIPPSPTQWVTDTAGLLSAQNVRQLNERLGAYETATRHQVLVYITPTTGDTPLEEWTVRAFKNWKVGRKRLDDGLVLFIFSRDHKLRIEVGYGLEASVPDVVASRIIRETIEPRLRAGEPDQGVTDGVEQLLRQIGGESSTSANASKETPGTPLTAFLIVLGVVAFIIFAIRSPWLAFYFLVNIFGGRGGSMGSGSSGGFQGGGGRSGGGGASGSW